MREKVIEDLIANFPSEFFGENLRLFGRQIRIKGRVLDLVFEDDLGRLLLIEVKAVVLEREAVGQAGEYFGLMKLEFPDRMVRVAVFAPIVQPERRFFLEAIGIEVYICDLKKLEAIAAKYSVDLVHGIPVDPKTKSRKVYEPKDLDRVPVVSEEDYFELIQSLSQSSQEKLMAIYAAIKKNPLTEIRFLARGRIVVSLRGKNESLIDLMFVGVDFKGPKDCPARGTLTILWRRMLRYFSTDILFPFAETLDELLGRSLSDEFFDPKGTKGTYDTLVLDSEFDRSEKFRDFLTALDSHIERLSIADRQ